MMTLMSMAMITMKDGDVYNDKSDDDDNNNDDDPDEDNDNDNDDDGGDNDDDSSGQLFIFSLFQIRL
jgi:hypothetical protein